MCIQSTSCQEEEEEPQSLLNSPQKVLWWIGCCNDLREKYCLFQNVHRAVNSNVFLEILLNMESSKAKKNSSNFCDFISMLTDSGT